MRISDWSSDVCSSDLVSLVEDQESGAPQRRLPKLRFAMAAQPGYFDAEGRPQRGQWGEVAFPEVSDPHAYALEISGEGLLPVYRNGDLVVVTPTARSEEHTSELQSLMRISYAVFCLK